MHINILRYKKFKYLKLFLMLLIVSIIIYFTQGEAQPANGGTWQGYTLGVFSTVLILLLSYLGIRKRSYKSKLGNLEGWTSAHVYLGSLLLISATLHAAFQVGWNIHTLAYFFMMLVILSGFYGIYTYLHYPLLLSVNNSNKTSKQRVSELVDTDDEIKYLSEDCSDEIRKIVMSALENTNLSKTLWQRLFRIDNSKISVDINSRKLVSNKKQKKVIELIAAKIPNSQKQKEAIALNQLLSLFSRRDRLLSVLTRELQIKTYFKVWLMIHIPMTFATLAALTVHILVVFIYW
jgi:hypothetical protein